MGTTPSPTPEPTAPAPELERADIGIAGAGQLARMTCLAAWPLGIRVAVLGRPDEPAASMAASLIEGDWHDAEAVAALGRASAVLTLENEFVEAAALAAVEAAGTPVRPSASSIATVQDKALQKQMLLEAGLPVPRFLVADRVEEIATAGRDLGWPLMLKARKLGYDGRGNATCRTPDEAATAFERLDAGEGVLIEQMVPFDTELAVMVARSTAKEHAAYPVVETIQRDHVCNEVRAPARLEHSVTLRAQDVATNAAEVAGGLGVTGVEMFLIDEDVLINELAPRPHNSGHYTIEACETSQFENHVRGVLGFPLGSVEMRAPAAVMINLLGTRTAPAHPRIGPALGVEGAHVHLYGKRELRPGRKMGHVTCLGPDLTIAHSRAQHAAGEVGL